MNWDVLSALIRAADSMMVLSSGDTRSSILLVFAAIAMSLQSHDMGDRSRREWGFVKEVILIVETEIIPRGPLSFSQGRFAALTRSEEAKNCSASLSAGRKGLRSQPYGQLYQIRLQQAILDAGKFSFSSFSRNGLQDLLVKLKSLNSPSARKRYLL